MDVWIWDTESDDRTGQECQESGVMPCFGNDQLLYLFRGKIRSICWDHIL